MYVALTNSMNLSLIFQQRYAIQPEQPPLSLLQNSNCLVTSLSKSTFFWSGKGPSGGPWSQTRYMYIHVSKGSIWDLQKV